MNWRRAAAICLLVFCIAVSAFSPTASPFLSAKSDAPQPPLGVTAVEAALVCVFGNKSENLPSSESQPAIASVANGLLLHGEDGGLLRGSLDGAPPNQTAAAADIRGPPHCTHS